MCFKCFSVNDLNNSSGLYFLNLSNSVNKLKKIVNLKLLNYSETFNDTLPKFCIEQNGGLISNLSQISNQKYKLYNYINLPNNVFFESNSTFLNTEGVFKKSVKMISTNKQGKEDWLIIRKIFGYSKNINYINNFKYNANISFNHISLNKFKNFVNFLFIVTTNITKKSNNYLTKTVSSVKVKPIKKLTPGKSKLFYTKLKIWIQDFYIGGKDPYSKHSSTMVKCSMNLRNEKSNFLHIT